MTARDLYGHTYIDKDGKLHGYNKNEGISVKDWVFSYHYSEADGWSFMRGNTNTEIMASLNKNCPLDLASIVLEKCRTRIGKREASIFEELIKTKSS